MSSEKSTISSLSDIIWHNTMSIVATNSILQGKKLCDD